MESFIPTVRFDDVYYSLQFSFFNIILIYKKDEFAAKLQSVTIPIVKVKHLHLKVLLIMVITERIWTRGIN